MKTDHRMSVRFDMTREADARAWNYLHDMAQGKYKSISSAVIAAVNYYGDHKNAKLTAGAVIDGDQLRQALQEVLPTAIVMAFQMLVLNDLPVEGQAAAPAPRILAPNQEQEPKVSQTAMDFMSSF